MYVLAGVFIQNSRGVALHSIFIQDTVLKQNSRGGALHSIFIQDTMLIHNPRGIALPIIESSHQILCPYGIYGVLHYIVYVVLPSRTLGVQHYILIVSSYRTHGVLRYILIVPSYLSFTGCHA